MVGSMIQPLVMPRFTHIRMARWPKAPVEVETCIGAEGVRSIRRGRESCVVVVCSAGKFIGCVDNVKSE